MPNGRPSEGGCYQAGKRKLKQSRLRGEVRRARFRVQKSVKAISKLRRKGLNRTHPHINGETLWQTCRHGVPENKKETDKRRQKHKVRIDVKRTAQQRGEDGIREDRRKAYQRSP